MQLPELQLLLPQVQQAVQQAVQQLSVLPLATVRVPPPILQLPSVLPPLPTELPQLLLPVQQPRRWKPAHIVQLV